MIKFNVLHFCFLLIGTVPVFQSQSVRLQEWELDLKELEVNYIQSANTARHLSAQVDSLADLIKTQKKGDASILGERSLERLLARSQQAAEDLSVAKQHTKIQLQLLSNRASSLLDSLNRLNATVTKQFLEARQNNAPMATDQTMQNLRKIRQLMQLCRRHSSNQFLYDGIMTVAIDSTDTIDRIQQKSDFLLDQADRLRRQSTELKDRLTDMSNELHMRNRLGDFMSDLALSDPRMEVANTEQPRSTNEAAFAGNLDGAIVRPEDVGGNFTDSDGSQVFLSNHLHVFSNLESLDSGEIEKWMQKFEKQQKRWLFQADSLENRAEHFQQLIKGREERF